MRRSREVGRGRFGRRSVAPVVMAVVVGGAVLLPGVLAVSPASAAGSPTMTVNPDSGLSGGSVVDVSGSGFADSSIGNVLECNDDPNQPTVMDGSPINSALPVSCTAPSYSMLVSTSSQGAISTTYTIVQGTTGPPCGTSSAAVQCPATDSAGNSPSADAADYPCPPTTAQEAAGDTCELTYGDESGDSASADIYFVGQTPPPAADLLHHHHVPATRHPGNAVQRTAGGDGGSDPVQVEEGRRSAAEGDQSEFAGSCREPRRPRILWATARSRCR